LLKTGIYCLTRINRKMPKVSSFIFTLKYILPQNAQK
jgi:hypothetical protein